MNFVLKMDVKKKLFLLVGLAVVAVMIVVGISSKQTRDVMLEDRVTALRAIVEMSIGYAQGLEDRVQAGEITREQAFDQYYAATNKMLFEDGTNYIFVWTMEGVSLINPGNNSIEGRNLIDLKDPEGTPVIQDLVNAAKEPQGGTFQYVWAKKGSDVPVGKIGFAMGFEPWNMAVGTGVYLDTFEADFQHQLQNLLFATGVILIILLLIAYYFSQDLTKAVRGLSQSLTKMAGGDLDAEVPETKRGCEIGQMARATEVFREFAKDAQRLREEQTAMEAKAEKEKEDRLNSIAEQFKSEVQDVVSSVATSAQRVLSSSESMSTVAVQAKAQASTVVTATEQASNNVQTVAAAAEQMSASIGEINHQINHAHEVSQDAKHSAAKADERVGELSTAADEISEIVSLIKDIADQTNLLALNATIEAQRAGDAGRGFGVVASEVKQLAAAAADATSKISDKIGSIQMKTDQTVKALSEIRALVEKSSEAHAVIASAMEEQSSSTQEIVRNVQEAAAGTQEVAVNIGQMKDATSSTEDSAANVSEVASGLSKQSEALSQKVAEFITNLRKAA